ncbi:MAG: helix-turn-helix domain-containing protein [Candidatus Binatia bacterium]
MKPEKPIRGRCFIDIRAALDYTGLSIHTIYTMVSQRRTPFVKLGRCLRFDLDRLDEWIKENSVMPMPLRTS